eukprot:3121330-Rhodomonas_salina.1
MEAVVQCRSCRTAVCTVSNATTLLSPCPSSRWTQSLASLGAEASSSDRIHPHRDHPWLSVALSILGVSLSQLRDAN